MPFLHYSATIQDQFGQTATAVAYKNPADLTGEPAGLNAWLAALDAIISGVITKSRLVVNEVLPTTLSTTGRTGFALSVVEACCVFDFGASGSTRIYGHAVPCFSDTLISLGKPNLAATVVQTYYGLVGSSPYTNADGQTLNAFRQAYISFHKHRKELHRSSLVTP